MKFIGSISAKSLICWLFSYIKYYFYPGIRSNKNKFQILTNRENFLIHPSKILTHYSTFENEILKFKFLFNFSRFAFILREGEGGRRVRRVHEEEDVEDDLRRPGRKSGQHQRGHLHQEALRKVRNIRFRFIFV